MDDNTELILGSHPANERLCYLVTTNQPCNDVRSYDKTPNLINLIKST